MSIKNKTQFLLLAGKIQLGGSVSNPLVEF